jgi:hypothetical protein
MRILLQVSVAAVLYFVISLILEKNISADILLREGRDSLIFGIAYAFFLWIWNRIKKKP